VNEQKTETTKAETEAPENPPSPVSIDLRIGNERITLDCGRILVVAAIAQANRVLSNMIPKERAIIGTLLVKEFQARQKPGLVVPASALPRAQ